MSFSVLISVYFKEKPEFLGQALDSVINQTLKPDEVILVKDGPLTPELDNLIDRYCNQNPGLIKPLPLEHNVGLGEALKAGLDKCSCEIVARMDSDDICVPERFERQMKVFEDDSEVAVVGSWIAEFETDPNIVTTVRDVPVSYNEVKARAKYRNPLNHMTVMFRKAAVAASGGYKTMLWSEDYYLWVRMLLKGYKIVNLPDILVYVRAGETMFRRRGGLSYISSEVKLQREFYRLGFISIIDLLRNVVIRSTVRLLPNTLRGALYKKFLRSR